MDNSPTRRFADATFCRRGASLHGISPMRRRFADTAAFRRHDGVSPKRVQD